MAFSEGNRLLEDDFHVVLNEIEADMLQITKKYNLKWIA